MSAAINHVRLLAPEDFFAPIAVVMKAPRSRPTRMRSRIGISGSDSSTREIPSSAQTRASIMTSPTTELEDNGIVESDC